MESYIPQAGADLSGLLSAGTADPSLEIAPSTMAKQVILHPGF